MPIAQDDIQRFQMEYGAEWSLFIHSDMWQAAKTFLTNSSPLAQITDVSPPELVAYGSIYAAKSQGFQAVLAAMDALSMKLPGASALDSLATYAESDVTTPEPPPPRPAPVHIPPKKKSKRK